MSILRSSSSLDSITKAESNHVIFCRLEFLLFILISADEAATVRVTNLSEDTRESDLQELFRPFGPIARIYLAKDKVTNQSKVSDR